MQYMDSYEIAHSLQHKNVLITGASGFVGRSVIDYLISHCDPIKNQISVVCLSRDSTRTAKIIGKLDKVKCVSFGSFNNLSEIIPVVDFALHFGDGSHLLTADHGHLENPFELTKNLLQQLRSDKGVRFLYASSGAVYANAGEGELLSEKSELFELANDHTYQDHKLQVESILQEENVTNSLDLVITRLFSFVGPQLPLDKHFAIGNFLDDCLHERRVAVHGLGGDVRSYQHSSDMARWLLSILLAGSSGEIYNVGSDSPISIIKLAKLVSSLVGNSREIVVNGSEERTFSGKSHYVPCVEKAKRELNLKCEIDLEHAILDTFAALSGLTH